MGDPKAPLGSVLPHILLIVVQPLALSLPPFKYRALVFVPMIVGLAYAAYQNMFTEDIELLGGLMSQWPWYLGTIEKLAFTHPEEDFWRLDRARAEATFMSPGPSKLRWSAALWGGIRGVGWNHQVRGVPKAAATQTKWRFILHRLLAYAKYYLISDLLVTYTLRHYYNSPDVDLASLTIRDPSWPRSLLNAFVAGASVYFPIQLQYTLGSIIAVFLGLSQPKDWPPLFGNIRRVTTVRYFWGSYWHQLIRRPYTSYSQALVSFLRIPRGTLLSSYTQLYTIFMISAFFHGMTSSMTPPSAKHSTHDSFWLFFNFFIIQAMGIQLEDTVIGIYNRIFPSRTRETNANEKKHGLDMDIPLWKTLVGYTWVICWFWFSLGWGGDANLKSGLSTINPIKWSIAGPLLDWYENQQAK